jgi:hypothetical protein
MASRHRVLTKFMSITAKAADIYGPADRLPGNTPVVHKHDEFEKACEQDLAGFEVAIGSNGERYAVRKSHPELRRTT